MAFQNPVLLEWRTILGNVMLPLEIVPNDLRRADREARARALLALVGLEGFEDKRPVGIVGRYAPNAPLCAVLWYTSRRCSSLTNRSGPLMRSTREDLWQIMHAVKAEEAFTGVLITHDLREIHFSGRSGRCVVGGVLPGRNLCWMWILSIPATSNSCTRQRLPRC